MSKGKKGWGEDDGNGMEKWGMQFLWVIQDDLKDSVGGENRGNGNTIAHCAQAGFGYFIPPEVNAHKAPATPQCPGPRFTTIYQINCHKREIKSCRNPLSA